MKVIEALRSISLYPINPKTAELIAIESGLDSQGEATAGVLAGSSYKKAKAKVYQYLAEAPAVNEGGATYSFTDEERKAFRAKANALLEEAGEEDNDRTTIEVGWIGDEL